MFVCVMFVALLFYRKKEIFVERELCRGNQEREYQKMRDFRVLIFVCRRGIFLYTTTVVQFLPYILLPLSLLQYRENGTLP